MRNKRTKPNKPVKAATVFYQHEWFVLAVLLSVAVVLRVVYFLEYRANVSYYSAVIVDSEFYDKWAQQIASGQGSGDKPFYLAPLYPYFLALVYLVAGHNPPVAYGLNMILGTINLALVYLIGRRVFGYPSAVASVALLMLYAPLMYLEPKLLSETVSMSLTLAGLYLTLLALGSSTARLFLFAGLSLGLACIARPVTVVFVVLVIFWYTFRLLRHKELVGSRQGLIFAVGFFLPIAVVTARNWLIGHDFVPISTNAGVTFAQGNNEKTRGACVVVLPGFTGAIATQQQEEMAIAARVLGHEVKPSESSRYWLGVGLGFIRTHPKQYLKLLGSKLIWSLHNRESPCSYNFYAERKLVPLLRFLPMPFSLLMGLSFFGMIRARGVGEEGKLLGLYVASIFVGLLVFFVTSRYRMPAVPLLGIFGGFGLVSIYSELRGRHFRGISLAVLSVTGVMLLSLIPYPIPAITAEAPINLGISYMMLGEHDKAEAQFREALEIQPGNEYAHRCLADALSNAGKPDKAVDEYRKAIELNPLDHAAYFGLGMAFAHMLKFREAIAPFEKAVRLSPANEEAYNNLAVAYFMTGDYPSAWRAVHACILHGGQPHPDFIRELSQAMPEPDM